MIEQATEKFIKQVAAIQKSVANEIELILKSLEIKDGKVVNSIANLRIVGQIESKLQRIILNTKYTNAVKDYLSTFDKVAENLNNNFKTISANFKPGEVLTEIKQQAIKSVLNALTENGLSVGITGKLANILRQNISTNVSYIDLRNQLKEFIITNESGVGVFEKYVKQITTDALNQFNGQYSATATQILGLEWYQYTGSNLETTRNFCKALTEKRFVYQAEIPTILKGQIDGDDVELDDKTELPKGMIAGTNESNFIVYRGGYNCGHQLRPIAESFVPQNIRINTYQKYGVKYNSKGLKTL